MYLLHNNNSQGFRIYNQPGFRSKSCTLVLANKLSGTFSFIIYFDERLSFHFLWIFTISNMLKRTPYTTCF